jgi:anti-anti-sigma factor
MQYNYAKKGICTEVSLSDKFTFNDHQTFRSIMDLLQRDTVQALEINFSNVEFIDSAGLGMLLLLRDECTRRDIPLALCGAQGQVKKIFMVSRFDQLFTLKE